MRKDRLKTALVTGGSKGIGGATVDHLARAGYQVYFNYLSDHDSAEKKQTEVGANGGVAIGVSCDLRAPAEIDALISRVLDEAGGIDVLVSNAASGVFRTLDGFKPKHWRWTLDINAQAFLLLAQAVSVPMRRQKSGRIIAITSLGSQRVISHYALVGASKGALEALMRHFAVELAPYGIMVNAVAPGLVATEGILQVFGEKAARSSQRRTPAGRLTRPKDVAAVVGFLCEPASAMICGQVITVDGGFSLIA